MALRQYYLIADLAMALLLSISNCVCEWGWHDARRVVFSDFAMFGQHMILYFVLLPHLVWFFNA